MSSSSKLKVLIAGGGIAGHTLAYWLSKTGHEVAVTIVERAKEPRVTGQAIDISGRAVDIIKLMNLRDIIKSKHTTETGLAFIDTHGKIQAQFDATGDDANQSATSEYEILRAELAQILLDAIKDKSDIQYIYGESITAVQQTDSAAEVTFKSGKHDTFDLVVAADGASSSTRPLLLGDAATADCYDFWGQYTAFYSAPRQEGDNRLWLWYNGSRGRMLSLRPHNNPNTMGAYLCVTMPSRSTKDPKIEEALGQGAAEQKALLHEYFEGAGWQSERLLQALDTSDDFYMSRIAQVKLSKWTSGRGLVIGDAAHATMGVGTSLAMIDAYVLAGELSKISSAREVPEALARYESVLRPLVDKSTQLPSFVPQIAVPQTDFRVWLFNTALWAISKSRVYKLFGGRSDLENWSLPQYDWKGL